MSNILPFTRKPELPNAKPEWFHADEMAEHVGGHDKTAVEWLALTETQEYLLAMAGHLNLRGPADLYISKPDGLWLHPALYVCFARWANPVFGVWCDGKIENAGGHYA